ncbi:L-fuconate dehydratase [Leifsonia sp. YIM 134122]|uniref:L-fuconate dehydratase n=1 Tax=Leifsonia stereocauli TaxID=3134136 RepID=A0ABU9W797_9MICO
MSTIVSVDTRDIRFPTSLELDGSDAMNPDPDYSAAYVAIRTDAEDGLEGHAFVFTIGRGNDVQVAALDTLRGHLVGRDVEDLLADMGAASRLLMHDSQLRWLGPEKGVMHMAIGAIVNALWDLRAKRAGQPLWLHLSTLSPEELVSVVDFRYLSDALTPEQALEILRAAEPTRQERIAHLVEAGYPAYTTTPGWLGYSDEKLDRLCREAVADGFPQIKLKVGANLQDDIRRLGIAREAVGPDFPIAIDSNQRWDVADAIAWVNELSSFNLAWIEEPTSPDDILGHAAIARGVAPVRVATGEHVQNRIVFKQLLQAEGMQVMQIDATRVGGVNENIANLLLAAKFGVPVCPHAGGVGLCEAVQHLSMFDYVAVSADMDGRMIEFVDHLHEHFVTPTVMERGRYLVPSAPGAGTEMLPASIDEYTWQGTSAAVAATAATAAAAATI